jgi:O-antigen/teichoic acid export membrane protein
MLEQKKQFFTQIGILAIMFSLVFFVILLPKIGILPLVTAVLGTGMFVTGFVLLVAREKCIALWKELINRPDTSLRVMGILHILCALLLTYVLLIQNY